MEIAKQRLKHTLEEMYGSKLSDFEVVKYEDRLKQYFALLMKIDQRGKRKNNKND